MTSPTPNVVHMETAARLIREAKEAREARRKAREIAASPPQERNAEGAPLSVPISEAAIGVPYEDFEALALAIATPPQPNEALQRLLHNESVLDRIRGIQAQSATPQTDADPRNPNMPFERLPQHAHDPRFGPVPEKPAHPGGIDDLEV